MMLWLEVRMPTVVAQQVELHLTLEQLIAIVRQLNPPEQEQVRQAMALPPWSHRLDALLNRVWSRVERYPIAEEDVDAEVEQTRRELYAPGSR
jgi:hypothetical protein